MTLPNLAALVAASLCFLVAITTAIDTPLPTLTSAYWVPISTPTPIPSAYTTSAIVSIHFPYGRYSSSQDLHASIITVLAASDFTKTWTNTIYTYHNSYNKSAASATSYWLACHPSVPATDCEFAYGARVLDGPKTLEFHDLDTGVDMTCQVGYDDDRPEYVNTEGARCLRVSSRNPSVTSYIGPVPDIGRWLGRVTVTGGLEMLGAGADGGGSGVVSTTSVGGGSAATTTIAGDGVVGTTTGIVSESTSGSAVSTGVGKVETSVTAPAFPGTTVPTVSSSKTSTAGIAVVTGNLRVVAAVAAVFGGILVM